MLALFFSRFFKERFRSHWDLFKRIVIGLSFGTLFSITLVYVFRTQWATFPSSIFVISFVVGVLLVFVANCLLLGRTGKIIKKVVVVAHGKEDNVFNIGGYVELQHVDNIWDLIGCRDVDEIIICRKILEEDNFSLLVYLYQRLKTDIFFAPNLYRELLSDRLNGNDISRHLATSLGKKTDMEEFMIEVLDRAGSFLALVVLAPLFMLISILIKATSDGPVFYTQQRAGKDGKIFTIVKFRTMTDGAYEATDLFPVTQRDPRVTRIGKYLRVTRLDELPQLLNILKGDMGLVGPRPENLYRVGKHKALQGLRLAVKPGLTGLAQIRSFYDLHPRHKIKYDYLYIQRRSLGLNLKIILQTIPAIFSKKGW
jgi:lipopolysaccharide/colanic/teichoic acid biosynthesis glycosyltransferase